MQILLAFFFRLLGIKSQVRGEDTFAGAHQGILVSNHLSLREALLLWASSPRPIRFIVTQAACEPVRGRLFVWLTRSIAVSHWDDGVEQEIFSAIKNGETVCLFPSARIRQKGVLYPVPHGMFERLSESSLQPVYVDEMSGSAYSFSGRRLLNRMTRRTGPTISFYIGAVLPSTTSPAAILGALQELEHQSWTERHTDAEPLHHGFIRQAQYRPWETCVVNAQGVKLSRWKILTSAIALARFMKTQWEGEETIGILLPTDAVGVIANLAVTLSGRTAVNLNFTAGKSSMESSMEQASIRYVLTARQFIERLGIEEDSRWVHLEDVAPQVSKWHKLTSAYYALRKSIRGIEAVCGAESVLDASSRLATLFTSGSSGDPKGVPLTHHNLGANIAGIADVFSNLPSHRILDSLPLFHSFGYMVIWLGLSEGVRLVMYPDPLDAIAIGERIEREKVTFVITTPTFLRLYLRKVKAEQMRSVRCLLTGAEKLGADFAKRVKKRFGVLPIEGYGLTECSPVVATNTFDVEGIGLTQPGNQPGTVGKPLPGVLVKVVHPETHEDLPVGSEGLLLVKGPNVMAGYLNRPDLTAGVLRDGWYLTGDIARLHETGAIQITDRLSRFSKIGGEMVPHGKIEEVLHQAAETELQVFAVTAVPDGKKGERIAVLTTISKEKIQEIVRKLPEHGLPKLFIPRLDHFVRVKEIPVLGTGKLNLKAVRTMAADALVTGNINTLHPAT